MCTHVEANEVERCPRLTGIPPHIALIAKIDRLETVITEMTTKIESTLIRELDKRGIGSEVFQANAVLQSVEAVHARLMAAIEERMPVVSRGAIRNNVDVGGGAAAAQNDDRGYAVYTWGGRLHALPENFVLPRMMLKDLICYWHVGSVHPLVPPLKYTRAHDYTRGSKAAIKSKLSHMRRLMDGVYHAAVKTNFRFGPGGKVESAERATQLFEAVECYFNFDGQIRKNSTAWKTTFNNFAKRSYKLMGDLEGDRNNGWVAR